MVLVSARIRAVGFVNRYSDEVAFILRVQGRVFPYRDCELTKARFASETPPSATTGTVSTFSNDIGISKYSKVIISFDYPHN